MTENQTGPDILSPERRRAILREKLTSAEECSLIFQYALWEIYKLCGEDADGDTGPGALIAGNGPDGFARIVVEAIRELREECEERGAQDV